MPALLFLSLSLSKPALPSPSRGGIEERTFVAIDFTRENSVTLQMTSSFLYTIIALDCKLVANASLTAVGVQSLQLVLSP
jgi:hypothetical protein